MADDETFRLILALGMAVFLPVALYHRIRSQASGEKLDRRQEGLFILFTLRPCGLAAMGGLAAFCPQPAFIASTGFAALALLVIRTTTEEAKLVERFGDDYRRYMARTNRFFPRLQSTPPTAE